MQFSISMTCKYAVGHTLHDCRGSTCVPWASYKTGSSMYNISEEEQAHLVIGSTGGEAVKCSFAFWVSHTGQNLFPALGAHLPHCGQVLSLHALH